MSNLNSRKLHKNDVKARHRRPASILVVDDVASIRNLLTDVLSKEGYEVTTAADGEEAVGRLQRDHFELVISDLAMPGINGIQVLLEAKRIDPDYPVIIITAYPSANDVKKIMRLGAADFIMKPFNMDWIKYAVVKALEIRRRLASATKGGTSEQIAATGSVMEVHNPQVFAVLLETEVGRSEWRSHPCSLLDIRIDHLHTEISKSGAGILKYFEGVLRKVARPGDIVAQTGQRDFTMILPETSREAADSLSQEVMSKLDWWTMSAGVACFPEDATSAADLLTKARADRLSNDESAA